MVFSFKPDFGLVLLGILNLAYILDQTEACSSPVGLEQGTIGNRQITASSFYRNDLKHAPYEARLNSGEGWTASSGIHNEYIQLDLEGTWTITMFAVQGATNRWFTRTLRIFYSDDGLIWRPYNSHLSDELLGETIKANERWDAIVNVTLEPQIKARYIAFHPVSFPGYPALRLELYGCLLTNQSGIVPINTTISDNIEDNRTWIPSLSPIVISKPISILASGSLTIQAGVSVIFTSEDAGLSVFGTLTCNGVNGVPVMFSGNYPVTQNRNSWKGIEKKSGGKLSLQRTVIRQAIIGLRGSGIDLTVSNTIVHSCYIGLAISEGTSNSDYSNVVTESKIMHNENGLILHGTKPAPYISIISSEFSHNDYNGITHMNWDRNVGIEDIDTDTVLKVTDSKFYKNKQSGFVANEAIDMDIWLNNCIFEENSLFGVCFYRWYYYYQTRANTLNVTASKFLRNAREGFYGYAMRAYSTNIRLFQNYFTLNKRRAIYNHFDMEKNHELFLEISENTIDNQTSRSYYPVYISQESNTLNIKVYKNNFTNSFGAIKISLDKAERRIPVSYNTFQNISYHKSLIKVSNAVIDFSHNSIDNASTESLIELTSGYNHSISNNTFTSNEEVPCFILVATTFDTKQLISAPENYWGTASLSGIKEKICDFFINANVARVRTNSYFIDPAMTTKQDIAAEDAFINPPIVVNGSYVYEGILSDRVEGLGANTIILVNRSIIIEDAAQLELHGSQVYFAENRGIVVKGQLLIGNHTDTDITYLQSMVSGKSWAGIYLYGGGNTKRMGVSIVHANISKAKDVITVNATNVINVKTTSVKEVDCFIKAIQHNGNMSILIESSNIEASRETVQVHLNDTKNLMVQFVDSHLRSTQNSGVIRLSDGGSTRKDKKVSINIDNSTLNAEYHNGQLLYIYSCQVHLELSFTKSEFSSRSDIAYVYTQSVSTDISQCKFSKGRKAFNIQPCNSGQSGSIMVDRNISLYNNSFNLSSTDNHIYLFNYISAYSHTLNIYGNTFKQNDFRRGKAIKVYTNRNKPVNLVIRDNMFECYGSVLDIYGKTDIIEITGNTFYNNSGVLLLDQSTMRSQLVNLSRNIFRYNDNDDAIVQLKPEVQDVSYRLHIVENSFENNTGVVLTTTSQFITVKNNFFENGGALYNIKVIPGSIKSAPLNASLNYWGTTDVKQISIQIYDNSYDDTLFDVLFRPYLGSCNFSDIQDKDAGFIGPAGDIGGRLAESVTLTSELSPYVVTSNIEITVEGTLIIEAGVTLLFQSSQGIVVHGTLHVLGNWTHPVILTSEDHKFKWRGVDFKSGNGSRSSVFRNAVANNTLHGITVSGIVSEITNVTSNFSQEHGFIFRMVKKGETNGTLTPSEAKVENLTAANNTKSGIVVEINGKTVENVNLNIDKCLLYGNDEHGIHVKANSTVVLEHCDIIDNRLSGVYIEQNAGGKTHLISSTLSQNREFALNAYIAYEILLKSCNVTKHVYGYRTYWGRWVTRHYIKIKRNSIYRLNVTITDSVFKDNFADGIYLSLDWSSRGNYTYTVTNNIFQNGNRTLVIEDGSFSLYSNPGTLTINNNTFFNIIESKSELINFEIKDPSQFLMTNNTIVNSTTLNLIVIDGDTNDVRGGNVTIKENIIKNNDVHSSILFKSYQNNITLISNIFTNLRSVCELEAPEFYNDNIYIDAISNYWGSRSMAYVLEKVCGFEKNMTKSFVYYIPYFLDETLTGKMAEDQNTFAVGGMLGGEVKHDLTLTRQNSPYKISRSLLIRNAALFTVEEGTVLTFDTDRGIHVQGTIRTIGNHEARVIFQGTRLQQWFGVVLNSTVNDTSELKFTTILNTKIGIKTLTPNFSLMSCNISNSSSTGLTMALFGHMIYDFAGTHIENTKEEGILLSGVGNLSLVNMTVQNSTYGLHLETVSGSLSLTECTFQNCSTAVVVLYTSYSLAGNISVENSAFIDNSRGVSLKIQNNDAENVIRFTNNYFLNNTGLTLQIVAPSYELYRSGRGRRREVDVGGNVFENSSDIMLRTYNFMNLSFHDNIIRGGNKTTQSNTCLLDMNARADQNLTYTNFDVSTNIFEANIGDCIMYLDAYDYVINGTVFYNQFLSNNVKDSVLKVNTRWFNLSENIFDNPLAPFDVNVTVSGEGIIPASNNWWGSANLDSVKYRIFDFMYDPSLMLLNITPILTDNTFDCSSVDNCSNKGECVRPNGCRCNSGWAGLACEEYDCGGVADCSGNGQCIGPNQCECSDGWTGQQCAYATCFSVSNCSNHGVCYRPDICICAKDYTGNDCSSCVAFRWGPDCKVCPACQNGLCDVDTGLCVCNSINWAGYLCDQCNETFYGPSCLPLMMVLNIIPNQGVDKGSTSVHIRGHNFPETDDKSYLCKFGSDVVAGTWVATDHVICLSPARPEGEVIVEISPNGTVYTNNKLTFAYYATCPPGACGSHLNPPRGQCLFGSCSCNLPWTGDGCTVELLAPVIQAPPALVTISESSKYTQQLNVTQGSQPILWTLLKSTNRMVLNSGTGLVEWDFTQASLTPYAITVKATNIIGSQTVTWNLMVPMSYSAEVSAGVPNGVLPEAQVVTLSGLVNFFNGSLTRVVPVDIRIKSLYTGREHNIAELTNPGQPNSWTATYIPRADDVGVFEVIAHHPARSTSDIKVTWSVAGMRCQPSSVNVEQTIDSDTVVFSNISKLVNVGGSQLQQISSKINGISGAYARPNGVDLNSQSFVALLADGEELNFDLVITRARPLSGTIYVIFETSEGTRTSLRVRIRLTIQRPLFIFTPNSLSENIVRGTQKLMDIVLNNDGDVLAKNVILGFPNDPRISVVSISAPNQTQTLDKFDMPAGSNVSITIAVTTADDAGLGEMTGTIAVNSDLASASLRYKFYITSIQQLDLVFYVKDEYTYFASGSPLVSGAEVRLTNPRRRYSETRYTTNTTGYVTFENITEDQYSLYARADGHSSYSAIIIAKPEESTKDIFLQRVAVKYTWTVTPTAIEDKYIITLDSTFETFVPMPVVTIEPAKVNTIPYELGHADTIDFTIRNHGLIRADNLRFNLPNHPYLNFESTIETIGSIDANTTIVVPVITSVKRITKRNAAAAAVCGLALLYDYICGGTQSRGLDVTLTREYPGRPPLPCGISGGGGWGGGGGGGGGISYTGGGGASGSGSSMTYNPVTPLSCDCAKTLIKSCGLAFHPIAGCALAVTDLGTCRARSGGDFILGALNCILGVADTAFACVFGVICKHCGLLYTSIRCVIDVAFNCGGARRRREISSDVVDNMIQVSRPIDNFLSMMSDILGDEDMYNLNRTWYDSFKTVISDDSARDVLLSDDEVNIVLNTLTDDGSKAVLNKFLTRWNNTAAAWENGTLAEMSDNSRIIPLSKLTPRMEQYQNDIDAAKQRGFSSIFDDYAHATQVYTEGEKESQESSKDDNVCAKVRVRIIQELVLTRDAFNARLEIENGENSALENIKVEIEITQTYGTGEPAMDAFSIGEPSLIGISAVDGTGSLGKDLSGSAEWLMVPYSHAAPKDDTQYDVGGRLSYSVGGSSFSVPLLPDTITVKPNPSLIVHYFHEKYVCGDDPLTQEVEPIIPFTLAVMVMNGGYGVARALKISSAQPEIIENEKRLLITFKIIGSQIGKDQITPSLTVTFGDIESFETKTARWLLTSTLKGTFYNYSATFENINPLGDPQLSLLDELGYHELVHVVQIQDGPDGTYIEDDELGDFLVNDLIDNNDIPDTLYNSANGSDVQPVKTTNVTQFEVLDTVIKTPTKKYTIIKLTTAINSSSWAYTRVVNNLTSPDSADHEYLLAVKRDDNKNILVEKNAWQTTHILDSFFFHVLDYIPQHPDGVVEITYNLTFGPKNLYPPRFNSTQYTISIPASLEIGAMVLKMAAYDIDGDLISFRMINNSLFSVTNNGIILVLSSLTDAQTMEFEVMVEDSGVPSRSSSVRVLIEIMKDDNTAPTSSTSTYVTTTPVTTSTTSGVTNVSVTTDKMTSSSISSTTLSSSSPTQTYTRTSPISNTTSSPTESFTSTSSISNTTSSPTESYTSTSPISNTSSVSPHTDLTTSSTKSSTTSQTISSSLPAGNVTTSSSETTTTHSTSITSTSSSDKTSERTMQTNATISTGTTITQSTETSSEHPVTQLTDTTPLTTPQNGTTGEQEGGTPRWVILTAIGAAVFVVLVVFTVALVYAIRRKGVSKHPVIKTESYNYHPR